MDRATADKNSTAAGSGTLMLHLLGRCNLTCQHCYMDGSPTRKEELPLPLVMAAVADCPRLAIGALYLTGGEPLLYRGLDDVLGAAAEVPGLAVTLCTNGMLIKPRHAARLGEIGAKVNVSIDGDEVSGFFLMLNAMKSPARFSFTRYPGDHGTPVRAMAEGSPNPALNTWYHVAGVYDADAQTISLYVNGKKQSTVPCNQAWQAKGKTAIGRGFFGHKNCDFVNGMVSDVRLYSTALNAAQIQALAGQGSAE